MDIKRADWPCINCVDGKGKMPDGSACPICHGTGRNIVTESVGDSINDWSSRNFWTLVLVFFALITAWLAAGWRWVFGPKADK